MRVYAREVSACTSLRSCDSRRRSQSSSRGWCRDMRQVRKHPSSHTVRAPRGIWRCRRWRRCCATRRCGGGKSLRHGQFSARASHGCGFDCRNETNPSQHPTNPPPVQRCTRVRRMRAGRSTGAHRTCMCLCREHESMSQKARCCNLGSPRPLRLSKNVPCVLRIVRRNCRSHCWRRRTTPCRDRCTYNLQREGGCPWLRTPFPNRCTVRLRRRGWGCRDVGGRCPSVRMWSLACEDALIATDVCSPTLLGAIIRTARTFGEALAHRLARCLRLVSDL